MPKIKLTTIASDIKGKSQGSVFSTNRGGLYFRNNKAGTNKKSAKMGIRKGQMASLASAWRTLTQDEQDAWNGAVSMYPGLNAFGDVRFPTGYELYMQLNGALVAQNLPRISVPLAPQEQPPYGSVAENYPELFQFSPNAVVNLGSSASPVAGQVVAITFPNLPDGWSEPFTMSFRTLINFDAQANALDFQPVSLVTTTLSNGASISVTIEPDSPTQVRLQSVVTAGGMTVEKQGSFPIAEFSEQFVLTMVNSGTTPEDFSVFVNSSEYVDSTNVTGTYTDTDFSGILRLGTVTANVVNYFSVSDFRYFTEALNTTEMNYVKSGYVLGTERWKLPLNHLYSGTELESFPQTGAASAQVVSSNDPASVIYPYSFLLVPEFSLNIENYGFSYSRINIYASPPLSAGRVGTISGWKQIACVTWQFQNSFELQTAYKAAFGGVPAGATVRWYIQYLDAQTGQLDRNKLQVSAKKPRFKSGTELPDKVN